MSYIVALTMLFTALKLMGYIAWSWWLVISPLYVLAFLFVVLVVGAWHYNEKFHFRLLGRKRPF